MGRRRWRRPDRCRPVRAELLRATLSCQASVVRGGAMTDEDRLQQRAKEIARRLYRDDPVDERGWGDADREPPDPRGPRPRGACGRRGEVAREGLALEAERRAWRPRKPRSGRRVARGRGGWRHGARYRTTELAGNCHAAYLKARPSVRRRFNQAVLEAVYRGEPMAVRGENRWPLTPPAMGAGSPASCLARQAPKV